MAIDIKILLTWSTESSSSAKKEKRKHFAQTTTLTD